MAGRILIGVTGNIGSGKSTVARLFEERGCALVDADRCAHELYRLDPHLLSRIAEAFGEEVLSPGGELNRARLAEIVFGDPGKLEKLSALVHPALADFIRARIRTLFAEGDCVVLDAALIVELGLAGEMDILVVVTAPEPLRLERLMKRSGYSREEAMQRMASQMPEAEKAAKAHFVLRNEGTYEELREKVHGLWRDLLGRRTSAKT